RQRELRGDRDDEPRIQVPVSARHDGENSHVWNSWGAIRGARGRGGRRHAEGGRPAAPDAVRRGAGEPDQPVPVQQGRRREGRRKGRGEVTLPALLGAVALVGAAGCASEGATTTGDPRDPWEGFNRGVYSFNQTFDDALARPVATAYRDGIHD